MAHLRIDPAALGRGEVGGLGSKDGHNMDERGV